MEYWSVRQYVVVIAVIVFSVLAFMLIAVGLLILSEPHVGLTQLREALANVTLGTAVLLAVILAVQLLSFLKT